VIGQYIRNHYSEAVKAVFDLETELNVVKAELGLTDEDFEQYHADERRYLAELTEPSVDTTLKIHYIKVLRELAQCT
jgi:hypothetical protein